MLTRFVYNRRDSLGDGNTTALMAMLVFGFWAYRGYKAREMSRYPGVSSKKLSDLYGPFEERVKSVIADMEEQGFQVEIRETYRDAERQKFYRDAGWSKVTWGYHMAENPDGTPGALAIDLKPKGVSILDNASEKDVNLAGKFFIALRDTARKHGLKTGGEFSVRPGNTWAKFGLGWDPGHMEYRNLTLARARRGERPE